MAWQLLTLLLLPPALGIQIEDHTQDILVRQGDEVSLFCRSDEEYNYCRWTVGEAICQAISNGVTVPCPNLQRGQLEPGENSCQLIIQDVTEADSDLTYRCLLAKIGEDSAENAVQDISFSVSRVGHLESSLQQADEVIQIIEDADFTFTCASHHGLPAGTVNASLGGNQLEANEDGEFTITPVRGESGEEVRCSMKQLDEEGNLYFQDIQEIHRKIMVVFAPKPNEDYDREIGFNEETGEAVQVQIRFQSYPAPQPEQIIWHLGNITINPGQSMSDQFHANDMEIQHDDWVEVTLDIFTMEQEDEELEYYLEVENDVSEEPLQFPFSLLFNAMVITTVTDPPTEPETEPATQPDTTIEHETELALQEEGMSGGSVAAIVIILIIITVALVAIWWLKKNEKLCFKPYIPVQVRSEEEKVPEKKAPIVKENV